MADKRVTPHQKLRPGRNTKTPSNMNATVFDIRGSSSQKGRPKSAFKSNLDSTTCLNSTMVPKMKSALPATPAVDTELELDFAYNDYLQALMRKQITLEKIKFHETQLEDQICQQLLDIYNMEKKYSEIKNEIGKVEKLNEINELIIFTEGVTEELEALENKYKLKDSLNILLAAIQKACSKINVKPIVTQEEADKLVEFLKSYSESVEKMLASTNNSEEIHLLAESISKLSVSKNQLVHKQNVLSSQAESVIYKLLEDVSESFANENGY